ncbi:hypothetical protein [Rhodomicrobium lacus]|uniref:hypothetical protein n=1 Tax=Rhodomicrobium lacus TaxID=2498452 RepID=UPI000F8F7C69|nr:hypothetical protein [Rhodomicrobium lacus]
MRPKPPIHPWSHLKSGALVGDADTDSINPRSDGFVWVRVDRLILMKGSSGQHSALVGATVGGWDGRNLEACQQVNR